MSIFKTRKADKSSTTTTAAPAKQEKPVASQSEHSVVINVFGIGTEENWVHSNMAPQRPMPRTETMTFENMPTKNCAVPAGWFFPEYSDKEDAEMVYRFPSENSDLLALSFNEGAVFGTEFISFKFDRHTGTVTATAWGVYPKYYGNVWQVSVMMEVGQTFRPYTILPNGNPAMDVRLCDTQFVNNLIFGNNCFTRVGYGLTLRDAEDVYGLLLEHISLFIRNAAKGLFKHDLQIKANRHFEEYTASYKEKLDGIIAESDKIIAHIATKKYLGIDGDASDWAKVQALYDSYVSTTVALDVTGSMYYQLRYAGKICGVKLDLSKLVDTINLVGFCYEKLRGLFDLLRS